MLSRCLPLLALVFAACDSGTEDVGRGRFEATMTGDIEASYEGPAMFSFFGDPQEPRTPADDLLISLRPSLFESINVGFNGRPAPGTYTIRDGDPSAPSVFFLDFGGNAGTLFSTSGTVTITASTDTRVAGTFSASLEETFTEESTPARAQVTGAFDATFFATPFAVSGSVRPHPKPTELGNMSPLYPEGWPTYR